MLSVVIPYKQVGSDVELRYALRSIDKFLPVRGEVFIIGDCPAWLKNIIHIPAADASSPQNKELNIYTKTLLACYHRDVSETFYFWNDDVFLIKEWTDAMPTAPYHALLKDTLANQRPGSPYSNTISNTIRLVGNGLDFDGHAPILYNKTEYRNIVGTLEWTRVCGYGIKTAYCSKANVTPKFYPDLKFRHPVDKPKDILKEIEGRYYFSTHQSAVNAAMIKVFNHFFPHKSIYEKD